MIDYQQRWQALEQTLKQCVQDELSKQQLYKDAVTFARATSDGQADFYHQQLLISEARQRAFQKILEVMQGGDEEES